MYKKLVQYGLFSFLAFAPLNSGLLANGGHGSGHGGGHSGHGGHGGHSGHGRHGGYHSGHPHHDGHHHRYYGGGYYGGWGSGWGWGYGPGFYGYNYPDDDIYYNNWNNSPGLYDTNLYVSPYPDSYYKEPTVVIQK